MAWRLTSTRLLEDIVNKSLVIWDGFTMMATNTKVPKLVKRIGTHNGVFHCDEALACYMIKQLPSYRNAEVVRTRDPKILETCDIVVDVGGVYDPDTNRFDHHQRDFEYGLSTVRPDLAKNKSIKLSSAGLVYAHYGLEVISEILKEVTVLDVIFTPDALTKIYLHIYETFVEEIDAIDNGVPMHPTEKPRYRISTNLSARIHRLNPEWNTPEPDNLDDLFQKAVDLSGSEFKERVVEAGTVWWPARQIVKQAIETRKELHESGQILLLQDRCPWKEHLQALENELSIGDEIKFVIFRDRSDSWRVQGIPLQPDSFICRVFLHKDWCGVRDDQLSDISGIPDSIFCHATGFIGGNKTKEGALKMALKSIQAANE